jgi:murein L,D-transpeptidase YcbB/YkuD
MNTPIKKYIRTIKVNMERCRWIDPTLTRVSEYIINIPAFKLTYSKTAKELESNLLVGKNRTETVVFSGSISSIVLVRIGMFPEASLKTN